MGARLPFLVYLLMAPGLSAGSRSAHRAAIERLPGIGCRQARGEGAVGAIEIMVIFGQFVVENGRVIGEDEYSRQDEKAQYDSRSIPAEGRFCPDNGPHGCSGSGFEVAHDDGGDMRRDGYQKGERRDDVDGVPCVADTGLPDRLYRQHHTRHGGRQRGDHREVACKLEVRHLHLPIDAPVPELIPGERQDEDEPHQGVREHHHLIGNAEW